VGRDETNTQPRESEKGELKQVSAFMIILLLICPMFSVVHPVKAENAKGTGTIFYEDFEAQSLDTIWTREPDYDPPTVYFDTTNPYEGQSSVVVKKSETAWYGLIAHGFLDVEIYVTKDLHVSFAIRSSYTAGETYKTIGAHIAINFLHTITNEEYWLRYSQGYCTDAPKETHIIQIPLEVNKWGFFIRNLHEDLASLGVPTDNMRLRSIQLDMHAEGSPEATFDVIHLFIAELSWEALQRAKSLINFVELNLWDPVYGGYYWTSTDSRKWSTILGLAAFVLMNAYLRTGNATYLEMAERAIDFANTYLWDEVYGGYMRSLYRDRSLYDTGKESPDEHRPTIGLTSLYAVTGDESYLDRAKLTHKLFDQYLWDHVYGGYYRRCERDWSPSLTDKEPYYVAVATIAILLLYEETGDSTYLTRAEELLSFLRENMWDETYGGYYLDLNRDLTVKWDEKPMGGQAIIAEAFLKAYETTGKNTYLSHAHEILNLVINHGIDPVYGGVYYANNRDWSIGRSDKYAHVQFLVAKALAEAYRITGKASYLSIAWQIAEKTHEKMYDVDQGGYYQQFSRDWSLIDETKWTYTQLFAIDAWLALSATVKPRANVAVIGDSAGYVHYLALDGLSFPTEVWPKVRVSDTPIQRVVVADLDGDDATEILAATRDGTLHCLDSATSLEEWRYSTPYEEFREWRGIYTEDVDGDQKLEIVLGMDGSGVIVLDDDGTEKRELRYDSPIGEGPSRIAMEDFNGDGIRDLVFMLGAHLYPDPQPWIQVIDLTGFAPEIIIEFRHTYTGSGMTFLDIGDVNGDGELDFITGGWWCPVAVFNNTGIDTKASLIWDREPAGGDADKRVLYTEDVDGTGRKAVIFGTAEYWFTTQYLYVVNPPDGTDLFAPIPTYNSRLVNPAEVADVDGDATNEIIALSWGEEINKLFSINGKNGEVEWKIESEWNHIRLKTADIDADGASEIYAGRGNNFTCVKGDSTILWDYELGARLTDVEIVTIAVPDFSISAHPITSRLIVGDSVSYIISLKSLGGFNSSVSLSVSELPAGAYASFNPSSIVPPGNSILTIITSLSTPTGLYTFTITGTGGGKMHMTTVHLTVILLLEIEINQFYMKEDADPWTELEDFLGHWVGDPYFIFDIRGFDDDADGSIDDEDDDGDWHNKDVGDWHNRSPKPGAELRVGSTFKTYPGPMYLPSSLIYPVFPLTIHVTAKDKDFLTSDDTLGTLQIRVPSAEDLPWTSEFDQTSIYFKVTVRRPSFVRTTDPYYPAGITSNLTPFLRDQWYWFAVGADIVWKNYEEIDFDEVVVAVLDTGVDYNHPALRNIIWNNPGEIGVDDEGRDKRINGVDDDENGYVDDWRGWDFTAWPDDNDPMDEGPDKGHGTMVAGIIAAMAETGFTVGIAGVMKTRIKIMPLRVLGQVGLPELWSTYDIANGINYAIQNGANIISMSFASYDRILYDSIKKAKQQGIVLVAAAGNDRTMKPTYPASYDEVISISSVRELFEYIGFSDIFSNYGPDYVSRVTASIELSAPGSDICSTYVLDTTHTVEWKWGTSYSAPIVSAVAALILGYAKNKGLSLNPGEVRFLLRASASGLGPPGWDPWYGNGMVKADIALEMTDVYIKNIQRGGSRVSLDPPADLDLHIYDSLGRHVGVNYETGELESEIPGAVHTGDQTAGWETVILPNDILNFSIIIDGRELSEVTNYTLTVEVYNLAGVLLLQKIKLETIIPGGISAYTVTRTLSEAILLPNPNRELESLKEFINQLPSSAFTNNAEQRKIALRNKINEVIEKIQVEEYQDAINKLIHDVRAKMDGDTTAEDWIIDPEVQILLCIWIDQIVEDIKELQV
jgi:subtilisin family serine protease/mannose/cellobiose epimerase-like protein (N-acyl-D-glucosamine 2-epimerase family)